MPRPLCPCETSSILSISNKLKRCRPLRFASGGKDNAVIIWTSRAEGVLRYSHNDSIQCLAYNPASGQLVRSNPFSHVWTDEGPQQRSGGDKNSPLPLRSQCARRCAKWLQCRSGFRRTPAHRRLQQRRISASGPRSRSLWRSTSSCPRCKRPSAQEAWMCLCLTRRHTTLPHFTEPPHGVVGALTMRLKLPRASLSAGSVHGLDE